jgi:hypothetical protein
MKSIKENKKFFILGLASILLLMLAGQTLADGTFIATGSMTTTRWFHTTTLLNNGEVLITGGTIAGCGGSLATAEVYEPTNGIFSPTIGSMTVPRNTHTATLLNNGNVLVVGGQLGCGGALASAEIYNPATGTFTPTTGSMTTPRNTQTATLLDSGKVLITGGDRGWGTYLASSEVYDPATDTFTPTTGNMTMPRANHTATLLHDGRVLITGSYSTASAEIYDPATDTFTPTANAMTVARYCHLSTLLDNGKVLITGGWGPGLSGPWASAEIYDPATDTFTPTANDMSVARLVHISTLFNNGKVLLAGGIDGSVPLASAELYDPVTNTFSSTTNDMSTPRALPTATLLNNGKVLITGGATGDLPWGGSNGTVLSSAELYTPANQTCVSPPSGLISWWDADSVTGNTAFDIAGVNNGTLMNGATTAPGVVGQAFSFDGLNDVLRIPDAPNLDITNQITVDAWINKQGFSQHPWGEGGRIVDKATAGYPDGWFLDNKPGTGNLRFSIGAIEVLSSTVLPLNTWIHVAGVYDGSTLNVYSNGVLAGTTSTNVPIPTNNLPLRIGADSTEYLEVFNGLIDEVEVFNRALTQQEIESIFNAGSAGKCKNQPPVDGTLTATACTGQAFLSWDGFSGTISDYRLVYSTTSYPGTSCSNGTLIYEGTDTSFTHSNLTNGTTYYYRVCAVDNAQNASAGAVANATPVLPPITVVSPNGGEILKADGANKVISWNFTGNAGTDVRIELLKSGALNRIIASSVSIGVNGFGYYYWIVPTDQASGTDYRIKITSLSNTCFTDISNGDFSIAPPSITVQSPNGGEVFNANGTTKVISWNFTGNPGANVMIEIMKSGVLNAVINASTPVGTNGFGYYYWTIPSNQTAGSDYKIRVTSTTNGSYTDTSDNNFTIAPPSLTVKSPNGGEVYYADGAMKVISWNYTGDPGANVMIELLKGGVVNTVLSASTPTGTNGFGYYYWIIPSNQTAGSDYKIRVTSTTNGSYTDNSNNNFTIAPPSIKVKSPNGGEILKKDTLLKVISWNYTGNPGANVRVELLKGGVLNTVISASTAVGTNGFGYIYWTIPSTQPTGTDYKMRVTSTTNGAYTDISDNNFSIQP